MLPVPLILDVVISPPQSVPNALLRVEAAIVLWEVDSASVVDASQWLRRTAASFPRTIQIIADGGLSPRERLAICEFPVAVLIRHPEQLPCLRPLVKGHFATPPQHLD